MCIIHYITAWGPTASSVGAEWVFPRLDMDSNAEKSKVWKENGEFNNAWTDSFASMTKITGLAACLICSEKIANKVKNESLKDALCIYWKLFGWDGWNKRERKILENSPKK